MTSRTETDSLGSLPVPDGAYWGVHTERARRNFPISGRPLSDHPELVRSLAQVKQAAARANHGLGLLDATVAAAIDRACERILAGEEHEQFCVDVVQGGAGTSTNMNANEVIANLALDELGHPRGHYTVVDPIDHVNRSQSTNDVYPTAVKLALIAATERLLVELDALADAFANKGSAFARVVKVGRTQLQDAVPMTLGQEFTGFAVTIREDAARLAETIPHLCEINLGATAIGTGITADPRYAEAVRAHLAAITGRPLVTAGNLIEATSDTGVFMLLSGVLKRSAVKLSKICNDLRLLSSGPQSGLGEIALPARQAGSSIMPGKVNPVIPEVVNQVAFAVAGADLTVTMAAEAGQLQLNAFEPIIADSLLRMLSWLGNACATLRQNCIDGITANETHLAALAGRSVGVVTALVPHIGYGPATRLAKEALSGGASIVDLVVGLGILSREEVHELVAVERLTGVRGG